MPEDPRGTDSPPWVWLFVASLASGIASGLLLDWIRAGISRRKARLAAAEDDQ